MTTRVLPREEWGRLPGTELAQAAPQLAALGDDVQIVVVEHDGQIVGHWAVWRVVHLEGVWIAPAYRRTGGVARRLLRAVTDRVHALGAIWAWTGAETDDVRALLERLGATKFPYDTYAVPFVKEGSTPCQ